MLTRFWPSSSSGSVGSLKFRLMLPMLKAALRLATSWATRETSPLLQEGAQRIAIGHLPAVHLGDVVDGNPLGVAGNKRQEQFAGHLASFGAARVRGSTSWM